MALWNDVWRIINRSPTSTRYCGSLITVRDDRSFKGLPLLKQEEINLLVENEQKATAVQYCKNLGTLEDVKKRSAKLVPLILTSYKAQEPLTVQVRDAISNTSTMSNVSGQDPALANMVVPNVWVSPQEAAAIYSQKGLPETIINKKGKSPLLNGVRIKNPRLSPKQLDTVRDDMLESGLANKIVEGLVQSLLYGGALLFPMFKRDNPVVMHLPVEALLRYGVAGKGCVDRWVTLDRWNCVHIPNWNPTAKDFLYPQHYYIPFLGCHVSGERCARIVTAPQYGYWAVLMTLGWGLSDIPGWIESVYNYHNVMAAIPTMIAQMSVLVRTIHVDSYLATEGWDILKSIDLENTARVREASVNNPINMDVVGDLKAIERDFKEVPNLVRLIRQDVGAKANIPEELLWSSERGAFSSGDPTEGAQEKQWESIKYLHRDAAAQLKNIAMLEVINALGGERDVLSVLPYTTIEFDNPIVASAGKRAEIGGGLGKMVFDLGSAGVPIDAAMQIMQSYGDEEFTVRSDLLDELKKRQAERDRQADEKHDKEMELLEAQIDQTKEQTAHLGEGTGMVKGSMGPGRSGVKGEGYTRMEQHSKEKTRGTAARKERLQKAEARRV